MLDIFNIILDSCLNPMENSWYSCFSRLSAWLCPSCKFWQVFCGSWFQHQFSFQRLCSAIQIWSMCVPCLELELWSVLCIVQFSKSVYARKVHFYSLFAKNLSGCWILSNTFSAFIEFIIYCFCWFSLIMVYFFVCLMISDCKFIFGWSYLW